MQFTSGGYIKEELAGVKFTSGGYIKEELVGVRTRMMTFARFFFQQDIFQQLEPKLDNVKKNFP